MTFRWVPDSYLLSLNRALYVWHKQDQRFVTLLFCNLPGQARVKRPFSHRIRYNHCTRKQKNKLWKFCPCHISLLRQKILLPTTYFNFNTSACLGSTNLSHRMSRLKSSLETVSKALSVTQAEVFSRIARLKPSASVTKTEREVSAETPALQDQENGPAFTASITPTPVCQPSSSPATPSPSTTPHFPETPHIPSQSVQEQSEVTHKCTGYTSKVSRTATVTASQGKSDKPASDCTTASKQATPLFHPVSFSVNLDETYNYLAHHVNTYFSSFTMAQEKENKEAVDHPTTFLPDQSTQNSDDIPTHRPVKDQISSTISASLPAQSSTSSTKKGLGQYLGYTPAVQAFVGNYIAPLVPRIKPGPKQAPSKAVITLPPEDAKQKESTESKEQKAADEKARRLLLQREKIIARVSVDNRTRALVQALHRASDVRLCISRVEELSYHLLEFPETRLVAVKEKVIPCLLRLRQTNEPYLMAAVREALTVVGYIDPVKSRGIRILSIDGGGTRGLVALQTIKKLEELSGKRIYQLFDYICGVSTGAILGYMLGLFHIPLIECEELYRKLGSSVFKQNVIVGTVKMGWKHAFYDGEVWENVLKERMGSDLLIETSKNPDCPKVAAVSTVVNKGTPLKAYVFRNYNLPVGVRSHYKGSCKHKLWEAVRASSAAPGYFEEFALGTNLHQDGGLLINNPTALAIHECQCLWPNTPLQCVVSLGTGRTETPNKSSVTYTSLKTKLTNVISSATDTEEVHTMLDALLPLNTYFRFNPYTSEEVALDECRSEKLNLLQAEGMRYLTRNEEKMKRAVLRLTQEKSSAQELVEWVRLKSKMYSDLPLISKL